MGTTGLFGGMFSDVGLSMGTSSSSNHNIDAYGYSLQRRGYGNLLAQSQAMMQQQLLAQQVAQAPAPILVGAHWTKDEMEKIKPIEEDEDIITLKVQEEVKLNNDLFI